jgi:hypothetical protein
VLGFAVAHFTVGSAGSVALRAVVAEAQMRLFTGAQDVADERIAALQGKSFAERAKIIAGWDNLESVPEIRRLYERAKSLPDDVRLAAMEILLRRWVQLDPDSLALQAVKAAGHEEIRMLVRCFARDWAAGRSAEEMADKIQAVLGDVRKYIPELQHRTDPAKYRLPSHDDSYFAEACRFLPPEVFPMLADRLHIEMPVEAQTTLAALLGRKNMAAGEAYVAALPTEELRRLGKMALARELTRSNPEAGWQMATELGREAQKAAAKSYVLALGRQDASRGLESLGRLLEAELISPDEVVDWLNVLGWKDAGQVSRWINTLPPTHRNLQNVFLSFRTVETTLLQIAEAPPQVQQMLLSMSATREDMSAADLLEWGQSTGRGDLQAQAALAALRRLGDAGSPNFMAEAADALNAAASFPSGIREDDQFYELHDLISAQWPRSQELIHSLTPEAQERFRSSFLIGAADADPAAAETMWREIPPDSPNYEATTLQFAERWALSDLDAAQRWVESLQADLRAKAMDKISGVAKAWKSP